MTEDDASERHGPSPQAPRTAWGDAARYKNREPWAPAFAGVTPLSLTSP
ncbi:MAG: hypothetical protein K0S57_800 [Ramlibacter sp.]|jgi:hypothetical protein|nr:hypothetical protein [Ramlibacter sp.]